MELQNLNGKILNQIKKYPASPVAGLPNTLAVHPRSAADETLPFTWHLARERNMPWYLGISQSIWVNYNNSLT